MNADVILEKITALLSHQPMTCSQLATELNVTPAEIIGPLRQALKETGLTSAMGSIRCYR